MKSNLLFSKSIIGIMALMLSFSLFAQSGTDRLNVNLTAPSGTVSGDNLRISVTANDPAIGRRNGAGISRIAIQLLDANTERILGAEIFNRRRIRRRRSFRANFDIGRLTRVISRQDVILRVTVNGSARLPGGGRPLTVINRELTVDNRVPAPGLPPQEIPTTLEEELNRINALLTLDKQGTISGELNATVVTNDPLAGFGDGNGDGIADIEVFLRDANTGENLAKVDFTRGGGLGGFQGLAEPPFIANFDTERITSPSLPVREVLVVAVVEGFVQNSRIEPGRRIQPITTVERRIIVDNSTTQAGQLDVNVSRGNLSEIEGEFTFEATGANIASVRFDVDVPEESRFNVSGTDRSAPFQLAAEFSNLSGLSTALGFIEVTFTLTNGRREVVRRRFLVKPQIPRFINRNDGSILVQAPDPIRGVVTVMSLSSQVIQEFTFSESNRSRTELLRLPTSLNGVYLITVNGTTSRVFIE